MEDLKKVTIAGPNATTHIVFDEFDGSNMNPETILNLLTTDGWETLPARFKWVAHPQCSVCLLHVDNCGVQGHTSATIT